MNQKGICPGPKGQKPALLSGLSGTAKQLAEKIVSERKPLPQRLKPYSKQCSYRSGKPLRQPKSSAIPTFSADCKAALPVRGRT
jgi:hypothetical protein